jgi:hypothetical protein
MGDMVWEGSETSWEKQENSKEIGDRNMEMEIRMVNAC